MILIKCFVIVFVTSVVNGLHEGDIVLTSEQQASIEMTSNPSDPYAPQNAVARWLFRRTWSNGRIPYILDRSLNSQAITSINAAISDFAQQTCIRLVPRTSQRDYVRFYPGNGCFSNIGRTGGRQDISIGRGCENKGIVIHEIFHALGRWHEQSRPDRDSFVRILWNNILSGWSYNFNRQSWFYVTTQGVPYDYDSIMHYGSTAFTSNGNPTILPTDSRISASRLGQRSGLSFRDLQHIANLYCPPRDEGLVNWSEWSSWSQCTRTCNGGTRTRTRTCEGGFTCNGSNIHTEKCSTINCKVPPSWGEWGVWQSCTASCGGGRQRRSRSCLEGNTCQGIMNQFRDCSTHNCPQAASWSSWLTWSSCSRTCQGGFRQRSRICVNGNSCPGSSVTSELCNQNVTCALKAPSNGWSVWSECSSNCGGGFRFRTFMCDSKECITEKENCNTEDCKPEPELKGVQYHGCWYLNAKAHHIGSFESTLSQLGDDPTKRKRPVSMCGYAALLNGYDIFALSMGGHCITGSSQMSDYQYQKSGLCRHGKGGYYDGWYIMDVYGISDQKSFNDSFIQISEQDNSQSFQATSVSGSSANANSGAPQQHHSAHITIITALFSVLLAGITFSF